jgi:hypothetical protein
VNEVRRVKFWIYFEDRERQHDSGSDINCERKEKSVMITEFLVKTTWEMELSLVLLAHTYNPS